MTYFHVTRRVVALTISVLLLAACDTLGSTFGDSFTFEGELPADFSLKAQAHYSAANGCLERRQLKSFESGLQKEPQHYRFRIPVSYRAGVCEMRLARVGLFTTGRHGEQEWQHTYDNGELRVVDKLPPGAPAFQADGSLRKQATCSWWFQISHAISRVGQIEKLLNCTGDGAYLVAGELPGKTVRLDFHVNPEEEPSHDDTWIKFPEGWKPCAVEETASGQWMWCRNPPRFRTFQMNGRTCTVYPNCTE
ncbi:hypothetical protein NVV93_19710 [Pseudomonas sp. LS44]|uniref:hypothetical protein n=1 Tax=Pseudomonas sp. LS44 TaxID=1357074 RepID=UPI00215AEA07|nr:hypothetical protein [Pseudomonas sp. LS44]UVE17755.1 hypothetical protein NVV93_19710 [Pseudomonas sp. LS44]